MEEADRWMDLPDEDRARLSQFVYDLIQWGGPDYARRYLGRLWAVYRKDTRERGFQAFRAVLDNLHRVMLIKDEVFVAHLLTSKEKKRRDFARYRIDEKRGDRLDYVHLTTPRFTFAGRDIQFDLRSRNWQLSVMKRLGFLRGVLPQWHAKEKAFLSWYESLVERFTHFDNAETYRTYVEILSLPADVRGYRDIRYPKMDAAREKAETLLKSIAPQGEKAIGAVTARQGGNPVVPKGVPPR